MKGNFNPVAKHMRTFNHGGAHKNKKDLYEDDFDEQLELSEYKELTKYKEEIEENWGVMPQFHLYCLTNIFNIV